MSATGQAAPHSLSWSLTACPAAIPQWRRAVALALREWGADAQARELAAFGVSELLSNVIKHVSDRRCLLILTSESIAFRVSVQDRSTRMPKVSIPGWDTESGRGLWLLREMAADWGYSRLPDGKAVWFRHPLKDGTGSAPARRA